MRTSISSARIPLIAKACRIRQMIGNDRGILIPTLASRLEASVQCKYTRARTRPPNSRAMKFPSLSCSILFLYSRMSTRVSPAINTAKPPSHHRLPSTSPSCPFTDQAENTATCPSGADSRDKSEIANSPISSRDSKSHTVCIRCIMLRCMYMI